MVTAADRDRPRGGPCAFLHRLATALDASNSFIEVMVGLVVVIGVTSSSRIGFVDPALGVDAVLVTAVLVAVVWAVIDGGFVLLASWFRQGRVRRLARRIAREGAESPGVLADIHAVADGSIADLLEPKELDRIVRIAARSEAIAVRPVRFGREDWMSALATAVAMLLATLPPILPFLLPLAQPVQVAVSNAIAILTLFWVGWFWARWTDYPRWAAGLVVAGVGIAMVALTVAFDVA